jgi:hypothetical protein
MCTEERDDRVQGGPGRALAVLGDSDRVDRGPQCFSKRVMAAITVVLAAFLVQSDPPAGVTRSQIFDLHL